MTKYTIYFLSIIIIALLLGVKNIKAEEEERGERDKERQQPPMVNADDLAKEELFLLGSFPQLLHGFKARDIFAGGYQSALISDKGEFYYWGLVANSGVESPSLVEFFDTDNERIEGLSLPSFSSLSLGGYHILAIDESGKLYSMGRAEGGVLGHNDDIDLPAPKLIDSMKKRNTKLTAAGYAHSVAVADTGLFTWGRGERGQLGTGTMKNFDTPKLVKVTGVPPKNIKEICTGGYHTAILSSEGKVYTFGGNSYGALGHGHSNDLLSPSLIEALDHVFISSISCGGDHSLALSNTGEIYAWGWGEKGQLGTGNTENVFTPYKISFEDKLDDGDEIASITAGGYATSFVVTKKGKVFGFGWGEFGILGNGGNDNLLEPTLIAGLTNITKIATGYKHALALTTQGDVYVFGEDTYGSLGLGDQSSFSSSSSSSSSSPSIVSSPHDSQESILPSNFESVSPPVVDERFLISEKEWLAKGAKDTSGVIVYNTVDGFADKEYGGREEKIVANAWAVGISKQEKAKDNLEDYAIVVDRYGKEIDDGFTRVVFGVYDGHNGKSIAEFSSFTLHKSLLRELKNTSQTTEQAIIRAYEYTNEAVKVIIEKEKHTISGSTALTCVSVRNGSVHYLFSANSGDSRAVLSRKGKAIRLTHDDKAIDESEAARVEAAGGKILNKRVGGVLAITRAIGDTFFNGIVIPTPHVSKKDILPLEDDYLILASDGLWDVMTDQEAVDMIQNEKDSQKASKILMKAAVSRGSKDDITVLTARVVRPLFLG